jgi:hypothetical protein
MNNLSSSYSNLGRYEEALVLAEETLEFQRLVLPENHEEIGTCLLCISCNLHSLGDSRRALEMAQKALRVYQATLQPSHPFVKRAQQQFSILRQLVLLSDICRS